MPALSLWQATHWLLTNSGRSVCSKAESPFAGSELLEVTGLLDWVPELDLGAEEELGDITRLATLDAMGELLLDRTLLGTKSLETAAGELTDTRLEALTELDVEFTPPVQALTTKAAAPIAHIFFIIAKALILACNRLPLRSWQA
jgi:hypothetical protein